MAHTSSSSREAEAAINRANNRVFCQVYVRPLASEVTGGLLASTFLTRFGTKPGMLVDIDECTPKIASKLKRRK